MNKQHRIIQTVKVMTRWLVPGGAMLAVAAMGMILAAPAQKSAAAPYLGCSTNGYIVRDNASHTDIQAIDMVTGAGTVAGQVLNRQLNAIGYNPKDNHFYAWDLQNGVPVKVSSDFTTVTPLTFSGYSGPTTNIFSGDVDVDGHYWFFAGTAWHQIDLNTSPNPTSVSQGTFSGITGSNGTDWAFMPDTNSIYRAMDEGGVVRIWAFDRTSKAWSLVGNTNISTASDGDIGSIYADPKMNLYMSSHNSGKLFRIDLNDTPPFSAVELDAVAANSNDGARCALASVTTDFGDAPAGYDTLIDDDGPRHNVVSFDTSNSAAPLMLGKKVDIEEDAFPNADASGDDADHEGVSGGSFVDDERGVTHIVATPNNSDPLTVPVYVTNTSAQAATLAGWIDLDNDGTFETGERVSATIAAGFTGYHDLTFPTPPAPYIANTFARFRIFSASDTSTAATSLLPTSPAIGGEVEDVLVQVGGYDVSKSANPAEGTSVNSGATVTYTLTINNTGSTPLANLKLDDDLRDVLDDATVQGAPTVNPVSAGSANVNGNTLEFIGDVGVGGTVIVTYTVKIKESGTLGNSALNNYVLAAHSASCDPAVSGGSATVTDPDCVTNHGVNGLANTGTNMTTLLALSVTLLASAGYLLIRRLNLRPLIR